MHIAPTLGHLEAAIMAVLWQAVGPLKGRDVHTALQQRELAYKTVLTTMDRLCGKGLLCRMAVTRGTRGVVYEYTAAVSRGQVLATTLDQLYVQIGADQDDLDAALAIVLGDLMEAGA